MKKGVISKLGNGYWQVWIKVGGVTTTMKAVAKSDAKVGDVLKQVVADYDLDQVGVKAADVGPHTALACYQSTGGSILWMNQGWKG